ncbi:nucleoside triphosphate pyrophosphohydrolase [Candidatus Margulisiibacteriota bacterium]
MQELKEFIEIIKTLRGPNGCPWDKKQTIESLTPYIIEEAHELVDAIKHHTYTDVKEELGDILLQVLLHSVIAEEKKLFTLEEVIKTVKDKMIRRHPHVFADTKVNGVKDVWRNWEKIKLSEKGKMQSDKSILDSVPRTFPALLEAYKIQKKVSRLGFDWPDIEGPLDKVEEEIREIAAEVHKKEPDKDKLAEEVGDLFFSLVNACRKLGIEPEEALKISNRKFKKRFQKVEQICAEKGKAVDEFSLEELDGFWEEVKK